MKKIILVRHAKSSWDFPVHDHDRPLTDEGIKKAIRVADRTINLVGREQLIWSSSAKRAASTALLFAKQWKLDSSMIRFQEALYTFDAARLESIVKTCPNTTDLLILFGHNNAITDFVNKFGDIFIDNVPTAGLVSIIFDTNDWSAISKGKTDQTVFPRDC